MQSFIDEFLAENCRGEALLAERLKHFCTFRQLALMAATGSEVRAGAAGSDKADLTAAAGADEEVRFYYASQIGTDDDKAWVVELTVPARATVGTKLPIQVGDRVRRPIPSGTIEIAGKTLPFSDGRTEISSEEFLAGIRDSRIAVSREGAPEPVPGRLLFF